MFIPRGRKWPQRELISPMTSSVSGIWYGFIHSDHSCWINSFSPPHRGCGEPEFMHVAHAGVHLRSKLALLKKMLVFLFINLDWRGVDYSTSAHTAPLGGRKTPGKAGQRLLSLLRPFLFSARSLCCCLRQEVAAARSGASPGQRCWVSAGSRTLFTSQEVWRFCTCADVGKPSSFLLPSALFTPSFLLFISSPVWGRHVFSSFWFNLVNIWRRARPKKGSSNADSKLADQSDCLNLNWHWRHCLFYLCNGCIYWNLTKSVLKIEIKTFPRLESIKIKTGPRPIYKNIKN